MDKRATYDEIMARDLYWLLDLNEALDVWADTHDLTLRPPIDPGFKGTSIVKVRMA